MQGCRRLELIASEESNLLARWRLAPEISVAGKSPCHTRGQRLRLFMHGPGLFELPLLKNTSCHRSLAAAGTG